MFTICKLNLGLTLFGLGETDYSFMNTDTIETVIDELSITYSAIKLD